MEEQQREKRTVHDEAIQRRQERSVAKRQRIIDAAIDIFAERGYLNTDVHTIAQRCAVGKGTLYLYFASKESLFWETGCYVGERVTTALEWIKKREADPLERLREFFIEMARIFDVNPTYISIINQVRSFPREQAPERINKLKQLCIDDFLCGLFREAAEEKLIPSDDPRTYTISVINSIWGVITFYHQEDDALSLIKRVEKTLQLFLDGIKIR